LFCVKHANFFADFFGENILKNNNIGSWSKSRSRIVGGRNAGPVAKSRDRKEVLHHPRTNTLASKRKRVTERQKGKEVQRQGLNNIKSKSWLRLN
jgi:hypothetical protein